MYTFAQKPKAGQQATSAKTAPPARANLGQSHQMDSITYLRRMLETTTTEDVKVDSATTETARFGHDFSRIPVHSKTPLMIQAKLTVSAPGDQYEQEVDQVAEAVMAGSTRPVGHISQNILPKLYRAVSPHFVQQSEGQLSRQIQRQTSPGKQTDDERRKCWKAASLRIMANGKFKLFGGLKHGNMARKSKIGVYTWDKRYASSVEFFPRAYFSSAALTVRPNARVKFVSINVPKNITHRIKAGVIVNGFPIRRFDICGLPMV